MCNHLPASDSKMSKNILTILKYNQNKSMKIIEWYSSWKNISGMCKNIGYNETNAVY